MLSANNSIRNFLSEQELKLSSIPEQANINYSAIHESDAPQQVQAKSISARKQVFYYYLNMLPSQLRTRFYSFSTMTQQAIKRAFRSKSLTSSTQAISQLTDQLGESA